MINMYKYLSLPFLLCLFVNLISAQKLAVTVNYVTANGPVDNDIIYYKSNQQLSWDDFKGDPVENGEFAAITSSGFGFNLGFRKKDGVASMSIDVYCDFSKKKSWVQANKKTAYLLIHEQHHFNVSYIYARKFIKKLRAANFTTENYRSLIESIYMDCSKEMKELQDQYDNETKNGQLQDKQEAWSKKLDEQLASLNTAENKL
jgi:hypothetical protein